MIQPIRDVRTGTEFVCEIPEDWNAALIYDAKTMRISVVMVHPASAPVVLERDADNVWRQREILVDAPPSPQG